jgi:predicted dehydrogenase/threonine dehydrogenase-like Zn-dependent dehydrogenase
LIANAKSVVSAGTEKAAIELARKSLLGRAIERPDQVRRAIEMMRREGILNTVKQVLGKSDDCMGLGYSSAGTVLAVGAGVEGFRPGDRVASNGPHAGVVCVPKHLCAHAPQRVEFDQAAYAVLGSIALQGVRLAQVGLGDAVLVVGLGLVGQIVTALLATNGCRVIGMDPDQWKCELALRMGAENAVVQAGAAEVADFTRGLGVDAVVVAASTKSDAPVALAGEAVRKKGRVVVIGAVGLNLPRHPFYLKEAELVVSCSYGPGRYDPGYEDMGRDYPAGYVRWTEQRNLQAILDMMGSGRLDLKPLTTHRYPIDRAEEAYGLIETSAERYLGVLLEYPDVVGGTLARRIEHPVSTTGGDTGIGVLGAGVHARAILLPMLRKVGRFRPRILCAGSGLSAGQHAEKHEFEIATTDDDQVFSDQEVRAVFILTRHDLHAAQVTKALRAGKHVFVEKPLALTEGEIAEIEAALGSSNSLLMVAFNRRFSPAARIVQSCFAGARQPVTVSVRLNSGSLGPDHWTQSEEVGGGRIIGEACHAIDLATFLVGSRPVRVYAESIGGSNAPAVTSDQCFITLRHANGSISSVAYLAGGDRAYPKERVEVLGAGRLAVIEDYREVTVVEGGRKRTRRTWGQDKGHRGEIEAFARALAVGGPAPIPWEDLRAVSLASILAVRSIREGIPFEIP